MSTTSEKEVEKFGLENEGETISFNEGPGGFLLLSRPPRAPLVSASPVSPSSVGL